MEDGSVARAMDELNDKCTGLMVPENGRRGHDRI